MEMVSDSVPGVKPVVYVVTWISQPLVVTCELLIIIIIQFI